jgi:hypothetical protein
MIHEMTADRAGLQLIGVVLASLTASVILIASVLVYKSAGIAFDQQTMLQMEQKAQPYGGRAKAGWIISSAASPDR